MIAIINIDDNPSLTGIHEYVVKINTEEICRFLHKREDGLSTCLRIAATAVDLARMNDGKEFARYMLGLGKKGET